jgi:hypothetical protein
MKQHLTISTLIITAFTFFSCESLETKESRLAQKYCASCHSFPEPGLLTKNVWKYRVLPQMAFRMGLEYSMISSVPNIDRKLVMSILPENPLATREEWDMISDFYLRQSPDSLEDNSSLILDTIQIFRAEKLNFSRVTASLITLITYDSSKNYIAIGTRNGQLIRIDREYQIVDSVQFNSAISYFTHQNGSELISLMGIMDPNDQRMGKLKRRTATEFVTLLDSLKRPVHFQEADLDGDGQQDLILCEFGNFTGELSVFKNLGNERFQKMSLLQYPGARKIELMDWDQNGLIDLVVMLTQGDERIILFKNLGNFSFSTETLLRFPSVYGSSYFELHDIDNDSNLDIIYSNGDNGDYSTILKPYHGLRIFMNNGLNKFKESWFYPMHGASQFRAKDYDKDGDVDILAISFFPDFKRMPEQGLIYFENKAGKFKPQVTQIAKQGRWITMEAADVDQDGDYDILLGALNFTSGVPMNLIESWQRNPVDMLILRNGLMDKK